MFYIIFLKLIITQNIFLLANSSENSQLETVLNIADRSNYDEYNMPEIFSLSYPIKLTTGTWICL